MSMIVPRELPDEEADAMDCLNHILTGTMHSRILAQPAKKAWPTDCLGDTSTGFYDSSWDFGGEVNLDKAGELTAIIVREVKAVLAGKVTADELEAAKSYALGRHQMGAQTVSQISSFYSNRYFSDGKNARLPKRARCNSKLRWSV